jgi:hypothetical protein
MANQRLSKQQKWILYACFETLDRRKGWENGFLLRSEVIDGYHLKTSNKAEASVSRAIRGLIDKGLVRGFTPRVLEYSDKKARKIVEKGIKPDFASILAMDIKRELKNPNDKQMVEAKERFDKTMNEHRKLYKPNDKLISPVLLKKETIKIVALTDIGKETARCLKLSNEIRAKLNIKAGKVN